MIQKALSNDRSGAHCGGVELCRKCDPQQAESFKVKLRLKEYLLHVKYKAWEEYDGLSNDI